MNMPIPSSVGLLRLDDVDRQAVALGDRPRLVGEDHRADVVRRAVRQRPGEVRAVGDDRPAFGRLGQGGGIRAGSDEDQLVEDRRRRYRPRRGRWSVGRTQPSMTPRATSSAAALASPPSASASARQPDRRGDGPCDRRVDARPRPRRAARLRDRAWPRRPAPTTSSRPLGRLPAGRDRARIALAGQLAERDQRLELSAGAPIELSQRAVEGRFGGDGDDEDVRGNVPRLVGGDRSCTGPGPPEVSRRAPSTVRSAGLG